MIRIQLLVCVSLMLAITGDSSTAMADQQVFRVGFLTYTKLTDPFNAIVKGELARLGYREGVNVEYQSRSGERDMEAMRRQTRELVAWKPDLIVSMMTNSDLAIREVTSEIPVVFWSTDPVGSGFAESYRRPGKNFTGFSLEPYSMLLNVRFLKTVLTNLECIAHLYNPTYAPAEPKLRELREAGRLMDLPIKVYETLREEDFEASIAAMRRDGCDGVVVGPHELFNSNGAVLGPLFLKYKLAAIGLQLSITRAGGLATYGPPHVDGWAAMGAVIDKVLHGADPAEIPIQRRFKSPLTINLIAAEQLGLTIPATLIDEADHLIQ